MIADRAYDSDAILDLVSEAGGVAVIPSKTNRKVPRELDRALYARRNLVERFFGTIKEFRRVATRYEKRARNYLSTVLLAETRYRCGLWQGGQLSPHASDPVACPEYARYQSRDIKINAKFEPVQIETVPLNFNNRQIVNAGTCRSSTETCWKQRGTTIDQVECCPVCPSIIIDG